MVSGYFGHFKDFRGILVIFEVPRIFWSLWSSRGILVILELSGVFGSFLGFQVILDVLGVYWLF
jgi:hypothetical protein